MSGVPNLCWFVASQRRLLTLGGSLPTYSYACTACDHRFDIHQEFSDKSLTVCPKCEGRLRKLFGSVGVTFKGSGFYRTDHGLSSNAAPKSEGSDKSSTSSKSESSKGSSDSAGAAKPASAAQSS
ncbi:MAG TPA: FmdB family zinc ribbon protein [Actinomycetales bacterium]|nr:FmdB family zinc ribbon protein [Actinomycetales bacterium]